jgi:hypothetical protein
MADSFSRLQLCHRSSFIGKAQSLTMAVSSMTPSTLFTDTQGCRPATETILDVNGNGFSSSNTKTPMDIVLKIKMFINLDTYSNIFKINSCTWWINFGNGMVRVLSRPFPNANFLQRRSICAGTSSGIRRYGAANGILKDYLYTSVTKNFCLSGR